MQEYLLYSIIFYSVMMIPLASKVCREKTAASLPNLFLILWGLAESTRLIYIFSVGTSILIQLPNLSAFLIIMFFKVLGK